MRKTVSIILIITTALSIITACAKEAEGTENKNITNETTSAKVDETTTSEYVSPEVNYNGTEITVGAIDYMAYGSVLFIEMIKYCDAYSPEMNGDPIHDALYIRNQKIEEELGVKIKPYSFVDFISGGPEIRKLVLANEDVIDIAFINGNNLTALLGTDMIIDLYGIPNVDFKHSWWDQNSVNEFELFGKLKTVTGSASTYRIFSPMILFFNKKVAEEYIPENIYDLVRNGEWTLSKRIEMCRIVAHDLNGDGVMDIEDFWGTTTGSADCANHIIAGGVRFTVKDAGGVPQIAVNTQRTADIIEISVPFLNDTSMTFSPELFASKFTSVNLYSDIMLPIFADNRALFCSNNMYTTMDLRNMEADFGILPHAKFDAEQENYYCPLTPAWCTFVVVPSTNSKLEITGHVLDALGYYSQQEVTPACIENTVKTKTFRDEDSAEMLQLIFDNCFYDLAMLYDWGTIYYGINAMSYSKNTNFASTFAKMETKIQTEIDKTMEMLK